MQYPYYQPPVVTSDTLPIGYMFDGVPAAVKTDNSDVVAGEVGIDLEGLYLYFNPADVGKTIELECTRYWNK